MKPKLNLVVWTFLKGQTRLLVMALVLGLLANLLTILIPIAIGRAYELLFEFSSHRLAYFEFVPEGWWDSGDQFLIFFLVVVVARTLLVFAQRFSVGVLGERFSKSIREKLFAHQLLAKYPIYEEKGTDKYLLRYSGDMRSAQRYLTQGIVRFINDLILLILGFTILFWIDIHITIYVLTGIVVVLVVMYFFNNKLYVVSKAQRDKRSGLLGFVNQRLTSLISLKAFNKAPVEEKKFKKRSAELYRLGIRYQLVYNAIMAVIPGLLFLVLGGILFLAFRQMESDSAISGSVLLGYILLFITMQPILRRTLRVGTIWKMGGISLDKLGNILSQPIENIEGNKKIELSEGTVIIDQLTFTYPSTSTPILDQFSLEAKRGEVNNVVMGNGQGATTLIKLLTKLYPVSKGTICIDGQNIQKYSARQLRRNIAVVSDALPLYGNTVFEAISYSRKEEKRAPAARMLNMLQRGFDQEQVLHLDDKIGAQGKRLSESQIRILKYARAFLTDKPIIIFEKPFLFLSTGTRHTIAKQLKDIVADKTIIVLDNIKHVELS